MNQGGFQKGEKKKLGSIWWKIWRETLDGQGFSKKNYGNNVSFLNFFAKSLIRSKLNSKTRLNIGLLMLYMPP